MHCTRKSIAVVLLALGLAAGSAQAADVESGWYLGVDVGQREYKYDEGSFSDTAYSVHGGYRFARHFAVETAYVDLGDHDFSLGCPADACVPETYPWHVDVSAQRWDLALLGIVPVGGRMEAYAKLGMARTDFDITIVEGLQGTSHDSVSGWDPVYGVGLRVHFDTPWSLRLQWERTPDVADTEADMDALWLGAEYRFGG